MKRLPILLLALGGFLAGTSEMIIAGILPFISGDLGVADGTAGQLVTIFSLAFALGTPVIVSLTSKMPRKRLLLLSLALLIAGSILAVWSDSYGVLALSRILHGVSAGVYMSVAFSAVAKLVPPDKIGSAIGTLTLGISSAMVLGVPIGVWIAKWHSWQAIFAALAILTFAVTLGIARLLPEIEGDEPVRFGKQFAVLKNPVIISGFALSLLFTVSIAVMNTYLTPYLQTVLHQGLSSVAFLLLAIGVFSAAGSRIGGFFIDRWGTVKLTAYGLTAITAALSVLPLLSVWPAAGIASLFAWMLVSSMVIPAIQTYFIQQASGSSNLLLSLNLSVSHLGVAIGSGAGGILLNGWNTPYYHPWLAAAIAASALAAGTLSFLLNSKRSAKPALSSRA